MDIREIDLPAWFSYIHVQCIESINIPVMLILLQLLGGEVYHYSTKLMMKEPLIGGRQEWHQDYG